MQQQRGASRPVTGIDVAASLLARLAPRALESAIDRLRLDVKSLADGISGTTEPSFSTHEQPARGPRPLREIDPVRELLPGALRGRYLALRRDLRMIAGDLSGERPSPTIPRRRARAAAPTLPTALTPRPMQVTEIIRRTDDAVSVRLEPLDGARVSFEAGQFLTLHLTIDGQRYKRAYSLSCAPSAGVLEITCKRIEGGRVSAFINSALRAGDRLEVLGPSGSFVPRASSAPRHLVLIAGGSGITPCWSIAQTLLVREPHTRITLVYGNRSERDVIFAGEIRELARASGARFEVVEVLSHPGASWTGRRGMLDRPTVEAIARELERDAPEYFVCGPAKMMESVRAALVGLGVTGSRIHEERFQSPGELASSRAALPSTAQVVTLRQRGLERSVRVEPGRTVLESAIESGVALPFSCAMGGCAACKCKVLEGHVQMEEPNCLSDDERREGWVLTCVGHPTTAATLEVP